MAYDAAFETTNGHQLTRIAGWHSPNWQNGGLPLAATEAQKINGPVLISGYSCEFVVEVNRSSQPEIADGLCFHYPPAGQSILP